MINSIQIDTMKKTVSTLQSRSPRFGITGKNKIWPYSDGDDDNEPVVFPLHLLSQPPPFNETLFLRTNSTTQQLPKKSGFDDSESFHRAIGPMLGMAQFFGLLPLYGVRASSPSKLSFKIKSFRTFYTLVIIFILAIITCASIAHMIRALRSHSLSLHGGVAAATAGAVFYGNSFCGAVIFFWLSPKWIELQHEWRSMEKQLNSLKGKGPSLRWKFNTITFIVLFLATLEHVTSVLNNIIITTESSTEYDNNMTFKKYVEVYTTKSHGFLLTTFDYSMSLGIFCFIISKIATFTWNFTDLFLMLISTGLAERYKYLNKSVMTAIKDDRFSINWLELREKYAALSTLVKETDNNISPVILLSFFNNLYFICLQLLNGLTPMKSNLLGTIYFFGSFGFLIGRTVAVTLSAAQIHDQSKQALPAIFNCPASYFNIETERLQHQLTTDEVVLTGMRFFSITRNFMLAIFGAIVTYEVVLLQFNVSMTT